MDFAPGSLIGSVSGELGLRKFLTAAGHKLVVTSDKDGPNCTFEKELVDGVCAPVPLHCTVADAGAVARQRTLSSRSPSGPRT